MVLICYLCYLRYFRCFRYFHFLRCFRPQHPQRLQRRSRWLTLCWLALDQRLGPGAAKLLGRCLTLFRLPPCQPRGTTKLPGRWLTLFRLTLHQRIGVGVVKLPGRWLTLFRLTLCQRLGKGAAKLPNRWVTLFWLTSLTVCLLVLNWLGIKGAALENKTARFLNDRAADIISTRPLAAKGLATSTGLTGKGQIIGLADSGLDTGNLNDLHPDLQSVPGQMPKVVLLKSWAGRAVPDDPLGHGTHMAATVVGTGAASEGKWQGIAPGASLYFQALLDGGTKLEPPADLQQLFYPAYSAGVRVHINGWGGGNNTYGTSTAQIDDFVRRYPDFLPIVAAGNKGPTSRSLTTEANSKNALVVGASQSVRPALSPEAVDAAKVAGFSSRGPAGDGRIKPDLVAPGSAIISACSSLVESNFAGNPLYTQMSGSSMGAAVAGGATALLREWFQVGEKVPNPSAALLKASLINGARLPAGGANYAEGFGVLDLTGTVLALKEDSFQYVEAREGVEAEQSLEYRWQVEQDGRPFKATLVWSDPAASAGRSTALVNDLDLVVIGPKGEEYWGNANLNNGNQPDTRNNVEQVFIPEAAAGEYRLQVIGRRVQVPATTTGHKRMAQDFALVFGQPVAEGTVERVTNSGQAVLAGGKQVDLPAAGVKLVRDGQLTTGKPAQTLPGAQLYQTSRSAYLIDRTWRAGGIQALPTSQGPLFMEIDTASREGGFYLDPAADQTVKVNETEVSEVEKIPAGGEVFGSLNPASLTLWQVAIGYQEVKGLVQKVDRETRQIWLINQSQPYQLADRAAITLADRIIDAGATDAAFGGGGAASLEQVLPGMSVRLVLSPTIRQVQYLALQRELALGRVIEVEPTTRQLRLESGTRFTVFEGAAVIRDRQEVSLNDLQPGDYVMAVTIPGSAAGAAPQIIHLTANSSVTFGRIIYWSEKQQTLYLADHLNHFATYRLTDETQIYRWGLQVEPSALQSGLWVRLTTQPGNDEIWRLDLAEPAREEERVIAGINTAQGQLSFADGTHASVSPSTLITKDGYRVGLEDLVAGERARLSWLQGLAPWPPALTAVEVETSPGIPAPRLEVLAQKQENIVRITGNTSADRLYLYRADGQREKIPVGGEGYFVWYFEREAGETGAQVVALDSRNGGVKGCQIDFNQLQPYGFTDIEGHWAAKYIAALNRRGTLSGYLDGTFRPDQSINRAELASLLVRLVGWPAKLSSEINYQDKEAIPAWAQSAVVAVQERGLMVGYSDNTFRPAEPVTRSQLAVVVSRLLNQLEQLEQPANREPVVPKGNSNVLANPSQGQAAPVLTDLAGLPRWARNAIQQVVERGLMEEIGPGLFQPHALATRAEAVAAFYRLLEGVEQHEKEQEEKRDKE